MSRMILDRRALLAGGVAASVAALLPKPAAARAARLEHIGVQLYTLREIFRKDPEGTLAEVGRIGYTEVEFGGGGYEEMNPAMLRRAMERAGLRAPSVHVGYDALLNRFEESLAMAQALGADTVVMPYMTAEHRNAQAWALAVPNFNRFAERLKKAGLGFAYHNHDFEFTVKPDGISLFERLLAGRDPDLVQFELDLYWTVKAGEDVKALIRRLAGQIYSYHLKDMAADGSMVSVGAGTIDFADIFTLNALAGVRHFYVENDKAPPPFLPDIARSYAHVRQLRFQPASKD